jgi:hypothetical protein
MLCRLDSEGRDMDHEPSNQFCRVQTHAASTREQ